MTHNPAINRQEWVCLFDTLPKEWMESVQLVLDYFCERTPRRVLNPQVGFKLSPRFAQPRPGPQPTCAGKAPRAAIAAACNSTRLGCITAYQTIVAA